MTKKRGLMILVFSLIILLMFIFYLTGALPWIKSEEGKMNYIIQTMNNYKGVEVEYTIKAQSMNIKGLYQWHEDKGQHRVNGAITSENIKTELMHFDGMINKQTFYYRIDPLIQKVQRIDLSNQPEIEILSKLKSDLQKKSIVKLAKKIKNSDEPTFKIVSINNHPTPVYLVEGNIDEMIKGQTIKLYYEIAVDGWGHIKKVDIQTASYQGLSFSAKVHPIKQYSILALNVKESIDF